MMTTQLIIHIIFSFLPFMVCLFWLICYAVQFKKNDAPKCFMVVYLSACVVLYLCHALFFTQGISYEMECVWTLCSLSVYPLFYGYLCRLTSSDFTIRKLLPWLVPGVFIALAKYVLPDAGVDKVRLVLFAFQIVAVCYLGSRKLNAFDNELKAVYADIEGRDTTAVHHLLIAIIIVSILSGVANTIGKQYFGSSLWLLVPISLAFSTMLFALSYICFYRNFTIDQFNLDVNDSEEIIDSAMPEDAEVFGQMIEELMVEQHYFLNKDLKVNDIALVIGSNRTYVSNYINNVYHCTFSDYMNRLRIEYAKTLLSNCGKGTKLSQIAEESGYSTVQSFFRNFKKFEGMTPSDWLILNGK